MKTFIPFDTLIPLLEMYPKEIITKIPKGYHLEKIHVKDLVYSVLGGKKKWHPECAVGDSQWLNYGTFINCNALQAIISELTCWHKSCLQP